MRNKFQFLTINSLLLAIFFGLFSTSVSAAEYKDYYATLGVPRTATQEEIRKAFRELAKEFHPDVAKDKNAAGEKFKEINDAYEVLGNPSNREDYDRAVLQRTSQRMPPSGNPHLDELREYLRRNTSRPDPFEEMFSNIFADAFLPPLYPVTLQLKYMIRGEEILSEGIISREQLKTLAQSMPAQDFNVPIRITTNNGTISFVVPASTLLFWGRSGHKVIVHIEKSPNLFTFDPPRETAEPSSKSNEDCRTWFERFFGL